MRLTVSIQDKMISEIMNISQSNTKSKAINAALTEWLRLKKIQKIKALRGKLSIENNIAELRNQELKEIEELNG